MQIEWRQPDRTLAGHTLPIPDAANRAKTFSDRVAASCRSDDQIRATGCSEVHFMHSPDLDMCRSEIISSALE
jgi:hypothetical protein